MAARELIEKVDSQKAIKLSKAKTSKAQKKAIKVKTSKDKNNGDIEWP